MNTKPCIISNCMIFPLEAPATNSSMDETMKGISFDLEFEERLQAVRRCDILHNNGQTCFSFNRFFSPFKQSYLISLYHRSTLDQKKVEEKNVYGTIDYDAPIASEPSKIGLGTKVTPL